MSTTKDRSRLCAFTFADGRQCRTPRRTGHPHLCYFHAQKEVQSRAAREAGEAISSFFFGDFLSACDLSAALGRVFSAVAQGHIKPKAATALTYLGQTLNQSVKLAGDEYANVLEEMSGAEGLPHASNHPPRDPQPQRTLSARPPAAQPTPQPIAQSPSQPVPSSALHPTSQPALTPASNPDNPGQPSSMRPELFPGASGSRLCE
jgi:hypothetical protein